jgi:hypothetical protein
MVASCCPQFLLESPSRSEVRNWQHAVLTGGGTVYFALKQRKGKYYLDFET